jgi:hypothetical protein
MQLRPLLTGFVEEARYEQDPDTWKEISAVTTFFAG